MKRAVEASHRVLTDLDMSFTLLLGYVFEGLPHEWEKINFVYFHRADLKPMHKSDREAELCIS